MIRPSSREVLAKISELKWRSNCKILWLPRYALPVPSHEEQEETSVISNVRVFVSVLSMLSCCFLNGNPDLRAISTLGQVIFGHFVTTKAPSYEVVFTVSDFECIASNIRQALLVTRSSNLKIWLTVIVLRSAELRPFCCRRCRLNCSTSRTIAMGFWIANGMPSGKFVVCLHRFFVLAWPYIFG
jgi:hypothetical protein